MADNSVGTQTSVIDPFGEFCCCCCAESLEFSEAVKGLDKARVDVRGHDFTLEATISLVGDITKSANQECVLEWYERYSTYNRMRNLEPNTWYNFADQEFYKRRWIDPPDGMGVLIRYTKPIDNEAYGGKPEQTLKHWAKVFHPDVWPKRDCRSPGHAEFLKIPLYDAPFASYKGGIQERTLWIAVRIRSAPGCGCDKPATDWKTVRQDLFKKPDLTSTAGPGPVLKEIDFTQPPPF